MNKTKIQITQLNDAKHTGCTEQVDGMTANSPCQVVNNSSSESIAALKMSFLSDYYDNEPIDMTIDEIVELIKNDEDLKILTKAHRTQRAISLDETKSAPERKKAKQYAIASKKKFPIIIGGAVCQDGKEQTNVDHLIPIIAIDIDKLSPSTLPMVLKKIKADSYTAIACPSPSDSGARAFMRIDNVDVLQKLWDETTTKSGRTAMYSYMWKQVAEYVDQTWGVAMDANCAQPVQAYSIVHDPNVYYNPEAKPFHIDMSGFVPVRPGRKKTEVKSKDSVSTDGSTRTSVELENVIAVAERMAAGKGVYPASGRNTYLHFIASIANQYGIEQSVITEWALVTMEESDFPASEIESCIASAYKHVEQHGTRQLSESSLEQCESILRDYADFRYNQVTSCMEIRYKKGTFVLADGVTWKKLQDRDVKTLYTKIKKRIKIVLGDVDALIYSYDFAEEYHPMKHYLESLSVKWDPSQHDYVRDLFDHLVLEDPSLAEKLYPYFYHWMVRMVALDLDLIRNNQQVPALIGPENIGKSYFFEHILPPELRDYFQQIRPSDKFDRDMEILLSQKLLAYFDERSISRRDADAFKALIGGGTRSIRKPYGKEPEPLSQRCSMGLSNNEKQYIGFTEGTRRLLSISIVGTLSFIDIPINYDAMYAQLYYEVTHGNVKESLTQKEVSELKEINKDFLEVDACEDAILTYYDVPNATQYGKAKWVSASEIRARINHGYNSDEMTQTRIGNTLIRLGFQKKKIGTMRYRVVERDFNSQVFLGDPDVEYADNA